MKNQKEELGLIWMSAGNPYFTEQIISHLINFALQKFSKVIIMAPDEPAEHTFLALGYSEKEAKKKARLNANLLQNRARRVVETLPQRTKERLKIVEWIEEIMPLEAYHEAYDQIFFLYENNPPFQQDAKETTKKVLLSKSKGGSLGEEAINEGVKYLLKELAFVVASPRIYKVKNVTYIYHKEWPIYRKFIEGKYDGVPKRSLSFLLVTFSDL